MSCMCTQHPFSWSVSTWGCIQVVTSHSFSLPFFFFLHLILGTLKVQKKFKRRVKVWVTRSPKVQCSCEKLGKRASFLLQLQGSKSAKTTTTSFRKFSPTRT